MWVQRITLGTLLVLAGALLIMGLSFYAPRPTPPSPSYSLTEVQR